MIFENLSNTINKYIQKIALIFLAILAILTFLSLVLRNLTNFSYAGTFDLIRIVLLWVTFLGASIVYKEKGHIKYNIFYKRFSGIKLVILDLIIDLIVLIFFVYITISLIKLIPIVSIQIMPASKLSYKWLYLSFAISLLAMLLHNLNFIYHDILKLVKIRREK